MKFNIKDKPNLSDQDIYDGEKHGVSFEWLIDKLEDQKAFLMKKNEEMKKLYSSYNGEGKYF